MSDDYKSRERQIQSKTHLTIGQYRPLTGNGMICPNCGQTVSKEHELCPVCGCRLHADHCTFCGAPMDSDDLFCGECGGSAKGIKCPSCGALSFRSFCPKCHQPVDEIGRAEQQKAKDDPVFQRICSLAEQIVQLQGYTETPPTDGKDSIPPSVAALLERYRSLQLSSSPLSDEPAQAEAETCRLDTSVGQKDNAIRLADSCIQEADLTAAIIELNDLLASLLPEPGQTPQMQRNYYAARKVAVFRTTKIKEPVGWVCNLCGCFHHSPDECSKPELGGRWIYKEKEITTKTYE